MNLKIGETYCIFTDQFYHVGKVKECTERQIVLEPPGYIVYQTGTITDFLAKGECPCFEEVNSECVINMKCVKSASPMPETLVKVSKNTGGCHAKSQKS